MASPTRRTWVWANQGDGEGQGSLTCCSPWGRKELDMTGRTELTVTTNLTLYPTWKNTSKRLWLPPFLKSLPWSPALWVALERVLRVLSHFQLQEAQLHRSRETTLEAVLPFPKLPVTYWQWQPWYSQWLPGVSLMVQNMSSNTLRKDEHTCILQTGKLRPIVSRMPFLSDNGGSGIVNHLWSTWSPFLWSPATSSQLQEDRFYMARHQPQSFITHS